MKDAAFTGLLIAFLCMVTSAQAQKVECPTISITGPAEITNPGGVMIFRANVKGTVPSRSKFQWTVSSGMIESGQGTRSISVRTPNDASGINIAATLKLTAISSTCLVSATELAPIASIPSQDPVDTYGKLSLFDEYARVQNGVAAANYNPNCLLVIIREAPHFGPAEKTRLNRIKRFINRQLRFPFQRLRIINKVGPQIQNVIWLVPPGARMPE